MSVITALVRIVIRSLKLPVPYTVVLLVLGVLVGLASRTVEEVRVYTDRVHLDPHVILHLFLPVLIFESAFSMASHHFFKSLGQVTIMAIAGLCEL